ncbi:hypothetical protein FB45DRAFT_38819 [Roridomyces roridus]|uniref:Uncharacterized protein n=1 Tax=Roridomyces roridus TaxID=1738132 RepID=A0AAD7BS15_9AGAR|nr:hypothetical protein FB45DRAFT_38819 [Roridomyces roridus]
MWPFPRSHGFKTRVPFLLFVSCVARESLRDGREPTTLPFTLSVDVALVAVALALYAVSKMQAPTKTSPAYALDNADVEQASKIIPRSPLFYVLGTAVGALFAIQAFTDDTLARSRNLTELHVLFPICTLVLLVYLRLAFGRPVESSSWSSAALQFCGLYMVTANRCLRTIRPQPPPT